MGLELVLDERAAAGKAALADGAVEGQRGGGAELTMGMKSTPIRNHCAALASTDKSCASWELPNTTEMREVKM